MSKYQYEVALSFAGEQRSYVEGVAVALQGRGISVFYDDFETAELWGKHLAEHLTDVYERNANLALMFVSEAYVEKKWPNHERRAILSRAAMDSKEYVLPIRFDGTQISGLAEDVNYIVADEHTPAEVAALVSAKLGVSQFEGKASNVPPPRMTSYVGEVVFDYSSFNRRYVLGRGVLEFETKWSKASNRGIHVCNDRPSINGVALAPREWTDIRQIVNAESLDYTSRCRTPRIGQIVLLRNIHGFYAAVQVIGIKDDTRGDDRDELRLKFAVQPDGTDSFANLVDRKGQMGK